MAKAYWVARVEVRDEEGYKPYAAANPAIFRKFGGRFVVRGGKSECVEGTRFSRTVVIEFPDYAAARGPPSAGACTVIECAVDFRFDRSGDTPCIR